MLALERRKLILDKLQAEKRVVVSELSQLYNVSEETIRRDLDKLEKEGLAKMCIRDSIYKEKTLRNGRQFMHSLISVLKERKEHGYE